MPELLTPAAQRYITRQCLNTYAHSPNRNNLDAHYILPECGVWQHALQKINTDTSEDDMSDGMATTMSQDPAGYYDNDNDDTSTSTLSDKGQRSTELPSPSTLLRKLRWTTLGYQYNWAKKQYYPEHRYAFPPDLAELTRIMVHAINGAQPVDPTLAEDQNVPLFNYDHEQYQPEAGVVNFYQLRNTLTAHVDKSEENMEAPLVSFR
jgi:alkylated DNA repair protein alkB family protein 1